MPLLRHSGDLGDPGDSGVVDPRKALAFSTRTSGCFVGQDDEDLGLGPDSTRSSMVQSQSAFCPGCSAMASRESAFVLSVLLHLLEEMHPAVHPLFGSSPSRHCSCREKPEVAKPLLWPGLEATKYCSSKVIPPQMTASPRKSCGSTPAVRITEQGCWDDAVKCQPVHQPWRAAKLGTSEPIGEPANSQRIQAARCGYGPSECPIWQMLHKHAVVVSPAGGLSWTSRPKLALSARLPRSETARTPWKPPSHRWTAELQGPLNSRTARLQAQCSRRPSLHFWPTPAQKTVPHSRVAADAKQHTVRLTAPLHLSFAVVDMC